MSTASALLAALLAALRADADLVARLGERIWDTPPRDAAFPHLVVEDLASRDRSGLDAALDELRPTLRIASRTGGRREALTVADRAAEVLLALPSALDGARLVLIRREAVEIRLLKDRLTTEAILRFIALVEPT